MKRRNQSPPVRNRQAAGEGGLPSLLELERFSETSLRQWLAAGDNLRKLHSIWFFALEQARQLHTAEFQEALQSRFIEGTEYSGWARIIDYRYSLRPLSVAGSIKREGGRFNIGGGLNTSSFSSFPALYVAQDYPTAFKERFGLAEGEGNPGLAAMDLALRQPGSFTQVSLRGRVQFLLNVADLQALEPFAKILRQFAVPANVRELARRIALKSPLGLVRSAAGLQKQLLEPNWRMMPMHFDLPSNSQVFGRLAAAAGAHGILYPSARAAETRCLALFPQNWKGSASYVEVRDAVPVGATLTRIDGSTSVLE